MAGQVRVGIAVVCAALLALAFALLLVPSAVPAAAAGTPSVAPTPTGVTVPDAQTIAIEQDGFKALEDVDVTLHSDPILLGTLTADSQGWIRGSFPIPAEVPLSAHEIHMTGKESGLVMITPVNLGLFSPTWLIVGIILGMIVLGLAAIFVFRGRARSDGSAPPIA